MKSASQRIEIQTDGGLDVGARIYRGSTSNKQQPLVLCLQGGAFLDTTCLEEERAIPRAIAESGAVVVDAEYGRASDFCFPEVLDHACSVLRYIDEHRRLLGGSAKSPVFVVGDEAGGNIAAGVALKARDRFPGRLAGQMLLSPMIDPRMTSISMREADISQRERWADGWQHYMRAVCGGQHPYAAPCECSRLMRVAPALLMTSEDDPLRDEVRSYAGRLRDAGVRVREKVLPVGFGWPGLYRKYAGPWIEAVGAEFSGFVNELRSGDRATV
ncbi:MULTISPECIES: alpha/beta hydrolase fold domain-containing protein [unclassified Rhizobium]|uniref:alpha/beta hydrolase fold domain-containing protein n=1 Tax=unclassified Rhizobium TaxID=2613769 RepID=UPI000A6F269F|nr:MULTISPECIES: alpha/beta hydrolase fold domain-containing protein [unclassified Rhizobium]